MCGGRASLCRWRELLRGPASRQGEAGAAAAHGKGHRRRFRVQDAVLLRPRHDIEEIHRTRRPARAGRKSVRMVRPLHLRVRPTVRRGCWSIRTSPIPGRSRGTRRSCESDEGWHVAGGFFPGTPFMLHGHNEHLGWANTVNAPNLANVYKLTINPANAEPVSARRPMARFRKTDAALRVKIFGPLIWTVHRAVLLFGARTGAENRSRRLCHPLCRHGRSAPARCNITGSTRRIISPNGAPRWRCRRLPSINYVYADEKGNIGYVYNGQFPERKDGVDWQGMCCRATAPIWSGTAICRSTGCRNCGIRHRASCSIPTTRRSRQPRLRTI